LKLRVRHSPSSWGLEAVFWRAWGRAEECLAQSRIDACYTLEVNRYNGTQRLQLNMRDFRASE
jgi:hypothetical protein